MVRSPINAHLIDLENKTLLDPFVGSGTALLEAQLMGLPSIGIDLDPLSVAMTQAKIEVALYDPVLFSTVEEQVSNSIRRNARFDNLWFFPNGDGDLCQNAERFRLPYFLRRRLADNEADQIENDTSEIKMAIRRATGDAKMASLLMLAMSDALARKLRLRFLGTGHSRFAIEVRKERVLDLFLSNIHDIRKTLFALNYVRTKLGLQLYAPAQVFRGTALNTGLPPQSIDLIVTSPPYLPAASGRES